MVSKEKGSNYVVPGNKYVKECFYCSQLQLHDRRPNRILNIAKFNGRRIPAQRDNQLGRDIVGEPTPRALVHTATFGYY